MSGGPPERSYKQSLPQQLRGFYYVATMGSFSVAADELSLGQPAVTLQVQALERELHAKLFKRKRGTLTLTEQGKVLFEVAAPVVEALESLDEAFRERLGQFETGKVTCAAPDNVVIDALPDLLGKFHTRYPGIDLVIYSCGSLRTLEMVTRGNVELGIGSLPTVPRQVSFQPLAWYDNYLAVPRGHPLAGQDHVSLEDVVKYPLVAPVEEGSVWQHLRKALERRGLQSHVAIRLASAEARLRYVELGLGVTIAAGRTFPSEVARNLVWIPLGGYLPVTNYGIITRKDSYLSLPAKRFTEFLIELASAFFSLRVQ